MRCGVSGTKVTAAAITATAAATRRRDHPASCGPPEPPGRVHLAFDTGNAVVRQDRHGTLLGSLAHHRGQVVDVHWCAPSEVRRDESSRRAAMARLVWLFTVP